MGRGAGIPASVRGGTVIALTDERTAQENVTIVCAWRCRRCGKLIMRYVPPVVYAQHQCYRCGAINVLVEGET